jgi:hypothetical protein
MGRFYEWPAEWRGITGSKDPFGSWRDGIVAVARACRTNVSIA